jgi:hypothetical protein
MAKQRIFEGIKHREGDGAAVACTVKRAYLSSESHSVLGFVHRGTLGLLATGFHPSLPSWLASPMAPLEMPQLGQD